MSKDSFLLSKLDKEKLKFPLFYKELKKDLSDFSFSELKKTTSVLFTEYLIFKNINLLKDFCLNNINIINKLVTIIGNKESD